MMLNALRTERKMTQYEVCVEGDPQRKDSGGHDPTGRELNDTQDQVHWTAALPATNPEHAAGNSVKKSTAFASEQDEVDYWEEVTLEDGSVWLYNHTAQDYFPSLPTQDASTSADEAPVHAINDDQLQLASAREANDIGSSEIGDGQVRDGVDGVVFSPRPQEDSQDMKASPEAGRPRDDQQRLPDADEEPFMPDDAAVVREQNLRALLVLLPAKFMKGVVSAAMEGAILHRQRLTTAEAERRRRSLLLSRAQFRYTIKKPRMVAIPGRVIPVGGMEQADSEGEDNGVIKHLDADLDATGNERSPNHCRKTMTRDRDTNVGHKLQEVLRVLYSTSTEEARLTMRAIYLSSQSIGAAGAQRLAPALKSCVIVALHLGNNAIGDEGVTALADGLRHARGLQKLHLNDNEITDVGCHRLANALGALKVLFTLDLGHNPFGDKACLSLATYLSQPGCPLQSLSIAGCLEVNPRAWKTINVCGSDVPAWSPPRPGDDGAVSLAAALVCPHGCSLKRLRIANAGMKTTGAKAIAAALCANHTLEEIDLTGNNFGCKAADKAWESAAELLSFGLQVNRTVRTVVLRACGLSREQILTIQSKASFNISGGGGDHGQGQKDGNRGGGGGGRRDGTSAVEDKPLPWGEEKRLGFRAACLRDWLLDAARVKGMRYPRPPSPSREDTAAFLDNKCGSGRHWHVCLRGATPGDSSSSLLGSGHVGNGDLDQSLVEPRLWAGLTGLQRLLASYESGESLIGEDNSADDNFGTSFRPKDSYREVERSSEGFESSKTDMGEANLNKEATDMGLQETILMSEGAEGRTIGAGRARFSTAGPLDEKGGRILEAPKTPGSRSNASRSDRSPESSISTRNRINSAAYKSFSGRKERNPSWENHSNRGADGEIRGGSPRQNIQSTLSESDDACESLPNHSEEVEMPKPNEDMNTAASYTTTKPLEGMGRSDDGDQRGRSCSSPQSCPRAGNRISAADLEMGVQEGRRLVCLAATLREGVDDQEAALLQERRALHQRRNGSTMQTSEEKAVVKRLLVDAQAAKAVAGDSVRRLEPVVTAARNLERARKSELDERRLSSSERRGHRPVGGSTTLVSLEQLESDWRQRSQYAKGMTEELQEAQRDLAMLSRKIEALKADEGSLETRLAGYDVAFQEKMARNASSVAHLRAKRGALRRTEDKLQDLAARLQEIAAAAREEEALRALVPAGSGRRDLDLQVAEAVLLSSAVDREVTEARLRRDEAAARLKHAQGQKAATKSGDAGGQGFVRPAAAVAAAAAAESTKRPPTAPALGLKKSASSSGFYSSEGKRSLQTLPSPEDNGGRQGHEGRKEAGKKSEEEEMGEAFEAVDDGRETAGTNGEAARGGRPEALVETDASMRTGTAPEPDNLQHLREAFKQAERNFVDAVARSESPPVKRALALIRDHGDILRSARADPPDGANKSALVHGRPAKNRRQRGETPLLGAKLNAHISLGAEIAVLRGSGEEDEEGNPVLPEIDDRFLTVGQRLQRLRDARESARREKQRANLEYSRRLKRNLRARKRFILAERRAGRIAQTMDTKQLVEALRARGHTAEESNDLDQLRRVFIAGIQPEMRIRLYATSRWTGSRNKHRQRTNPAENGSIAARRQRALLSNGDYGSLPGRIFVGSDVRHAATA